jgi:hypothetical protein
MSLILLVVTYIAVSLFPFVKAMTRSFSVGIGAGVNVAVGESIFALAMSLFSFIAITRICLFEYIYILKDCYYSLDPNEVTYTQDGSFLDFTSL